MKYDVKDTALAPKGLNRIEWADQSMPVDALRCTLSTINDHNTIGTPQATTAASPALGPFIP